MGVKRLSKIIRISYTSENWTVQNQILTVFQTNVGLILKSKEQSFLEMFTGFHFIPYLNNKKHYITMLHILGNIGCM